MAQKIFAFAGNYFFDSISSQTENTTHRAHSSFK